MGFASRLRMGRARNIVVPPPVNTVAPVITGLAPYGSMLSCSTGTWTGAPSSFAYQWKRDGAPISGALSSTYVTTLADMNAAITFDVTASNAGGSATVGSSNSITVTVALAALGLTSPNALNGTAGSSPITGATPGSTLTLTNNVGGVYSVNSATRTLSWSSSVATGTDHPVIRETLAGATNSPNDTVLTVSVTAIVKLAPSASWTGAVNSGWGAGTTNGNYAKPTAPADPTVAMPALRPLFLQHHFITGADGSDYVVFTSHAKGGIQKVRASMEGNFVESTTRTWLLYTDMRGVSRKLYGYVFQVDWAGAQAAHAQGRASVCAESWANDGAFSKQVIVGRTVHFRAGSALTAGSRYDEVKTVGSGGDYTTAGTALSYVAQQATSNPNKYIGLRFITTGVYNMTPATTSLSVCTHASEAFCDTGVTVTVANYGGTVDLGVDGLRLRGLGFKMDTSSSGTSNPGFRLDSGSSSKIFQAEGVEIYTGNGNGAAGTSGSGSAYLVGGDQINQSWFANASGADNGLAYKDCYAHDLTSYGLSFCESVINCDQTNVSGSTCENVTGVVHGGSLNQIGGYWSGLNSQTHSIDIVYAGGGGVASYSKTTTSNGSTAAGNGSFGYLNLYVAGVFITSFSLSIYKTWSALATAISTYGGGFSATADAAGILNTSYMSRAGLNPSDPLYPPVNFASGTASITSIVDIHADNIVSHGRTYYNLIFELVEQTELAGVAAISNDGTAILYNTYYGNINSQDTSSLHGITAQRGYLQAEMHHVWHENINIHGFGAGSYISSSSIDTNTGAKNCYWTTIFWTGAPNLNWNWQGIVVNINSLPSNASALNYSSVQTAAENTFMDTTTGAPVLNGALKNSIGDYCAAKVPTSLVTTGPTGNYGWNLTN